MLLSASSCHGVITETLWGKQLLSLQIVLASGLSVVPLDSSWLISRLLLSLCPWGISLSLYLDWTSRSPVLLKVLCSGEQRPCGVSDNHQSLLSFPPLPLLSQNWNLILCILTFSPLFGVSFTLSCRKSCVAQSPLHLVAGVRCSCWSGADPGFVVVWMEECVLSKECCKILQA